MKHKSFIVPHDFTPEADIALQHAIETSAKSNTTIHLLHVVEDASEVDLATEKLDTVIEKHATSGITITNNIKIGNIFRDISLFAAEHQAELIFMGTHGASGWQNIVGSHALRVVTSSPTPFVIVQSKAIKVGGYSKIIVPLDLHKETKQKLTVVSKLASYFNSEIHIVTPEESDSYLKHQVETNIMFAESYFKGLNLSLVSRILPGKDFDKEVVRYAVSEDADLIAIMNLNRTSILSVFSTSFEQFIISNDAMIPALILNPVETTEIYGAWFD